MESIPKRMEVYLLSEEQEKNSKPKPKPEPVRDGRDGGKRPPKPPCKTAISAGDFEGHRKNDDYIEQERFTPLLDTRLAPTVVSLLDEDGTPLGTMPTSKAIEIAREKNYDLFIVQFDAEPPVARIMDYGRFKFELEKNNRQAKKRQKIADVKEIKLRYKIEIHDLQVKLMTAKRFLQDGDMVKILINLRGRETQHADLALALMNSFAAELEDLSFQAKQPEKKGKSITMLLEPRRIS